MIVNAQDVVKDSETLKNYTDIIMRAAAYGLHPTINSIDSNAMILQLHTSADFARNYAATLFYPYTSKQIVIVSNERGCSVSIWPK